MLIYFRFIAILIPIDNSNLSFPLLSCNNLIRIELLFGMKCMMCQIICQISCVENLRLIVILIPIDNSTVSFALLSYNCPLFG